MKRIDCDGGADQLATPLATLLHPLGLERFFKDCWDRQPVFVAGPPARYDAVMRLEDFERALFDAKLGSPGLRFSHRATKDRAESLDFFLRKKAAWTEPQSADQLASELRMGTVVYVAIENAVPSIRAFCRSLFGDLRCKLSANAYFSAGIDASAFDVHFDPQDTFILQLEGKKEWRLWEGNRVINPISGHPDPRSLPSPTLPADETVVMTPGDLLYVPRGVWHWPRSLGDEPSLHLTLTVVMPRPVDIMLWLIDEMSSKPDFRAALPVSTHQRDGADLSDAIKEAMIYVARKVEAPEAASMAVAYMLRDAMRTVMRADPKVDQKDP